MTSRGSKKMSNFNPPRRSNTNTASSTKDMEAESGVEIFGSETQKPEIISDDSNGEDSQNFDKAYAEDMDDEADTRYAIYTANCLINKDARSKDTSDTCVDVRSLGGLNRQLDGAECPRTCQGSTTSRSEEADDCQGQVRGMGEKQNRQETKEMKVIFGYYAQSWEEYERIVKWIKAQQSTAAVVYKSRLFDYVNGIYVGYEKTDIKPPEDL